VVLDESSPTGKNGVSSGLFHGDGKNRWFDKSLQLIVFANGCAGINAEHSYADAMVMVNLGNFFHQNFKSLTDPFGIEEAKTNKNIPLNNIQRLDFKIPMRLLPSITASFNKFSDLIANLDLHVLRSTLVGRNQLKSMGELPPDAFIQLAMQLAYYKQNGKPCATYETGHTRKFFHGRTDTIRPCSQHSIEWTKSMVDPNATTASKLDLLKKAVDSQLQYTQAALNGVAFDRHMLGMRLAAVFYEGMKVEDIPIFSDPAFLINNTFKLSTSNIGSHDYWGGFAAVEPDGYGIPYSIQGNSITLNISSWKSCPQTDSKKFAELVHQSIIDIVSLFPNQQLTPKL